MKTYIMHLEQHDDIVSIRDKMRWGKAGRILLVWPESGQILNRRLDLLLLQRHSISLGAKLALVTRDREVRYQAPRLGIPVFKSLRQAQSRAWRVPRRFRKAQEQAEASLSRIHPDAAQPPATRRSLPERPPRLRQPHPATRVVAFTLGVLAFLSIAAVLLPSAEVTLVPDRRVQESTIDVLASPDTSSVELSGNIPATWRSVTVEGRDSLPVSGSIEVPARVAIGRVAFTNLTDQPVNIPEGTIVRNLGPEVVRFEVTKAGELPAGPGGNISLPVASLSPGEGGNLPAGSLVAVEGPLGTQVSAMNHTATWRGSDRVEPAPSPQDRKRLFAKLQEALEETALLELENSLGAGDQVHPDTLHLVDVIEENYQPGEKQPADHLELNLRLEYQALVISADDLDELSRLVLDTNLPVGFQPLDDLVALTHLSDPKLESDHIISWRLQAQRVIQAQVKEPQAIQLALGQTPEGAQAQLVNFLPLERQPEITISPAWWPRLPILPFRFLILYQESDPLASTTDAASNLP